MQRGRGCVSGNELEVFLCDGRSGDSDAGRHTHADLDPNGDRDRHGYPDRDPDGHRYGDDHSDIDPDSDGYTDADSDGGRNGD
jgi:hypothetical protein